MRWIEPVRWLLVAAPLVVSGALILRPRAPVEAPQASFEGGDFVFDSADGPVALHDLRGHVVLVYFGFGSCADVCPTTLSMVASALRALSADELARVDVLFVSLDPERDTLPMLRDYGALLHPRIRGVTGSQATLADVTRRYGAVWRKVEVDSALGYVIDHTSRVSVVDPEGRLVEQLRHGTPPDEIAGAIRRAL